MPTHIEHVVTEVIAEPEPTADAEAEDKRLSEQLKVEAIMKQTERYYLRLRADSLYD